MLIFCQDRSVIEQVGKKIYIIQVGDKYQVMNKTSDNETTVLGEYGKEDYAKEVLKTISRYIRGKKETYNMPQEDQVVLY